MAGEAKDKYARKASKGITFAHDEGRWRRLSGIPPQDCRCSYSGSSTLAEGMPGCSVLKSSFKSKGVSS